MNLLYAAWEFINPAMQAENIAPLADNLKTLELLREQVVTSVEEDLAEDDPGVSDSRAEFAENRSVLAETEPEEPALDARVETADICYTLGPFKENNIMRQVRDSLAEQVAEISTRKKKQTEKHRYWVYIPASGGRSGAKETARKLKEKQVKDFYIVLRGETRNSISLGHFREPSHASRRVKRIGALGFDAEINVIYRDYDVYWLDYRLSGESQQQGFSVEEYVTEGVSQISRSCDGKAP